MMWVSNNFDQTSAEAQALGEILGFICELCGNEINDGSWRERTIDEDQASYACVECVEIHDATAEEEWGDQ